MPMQTAYITHPRYVEHDLGGHPEHAGRLRSVWRKMQEGGLTDRVKKLRPAGVDERLLMAIHETRYLDQLGEIEALGYAPTMLGADTYFSENSYSVARLAAGGVVRAVEAVLEGAVDNAVAAVRPPGHHALADTAMGFCLLANVCLGAWYSMREFEVDRVMIVDYDVHHGNGTQAIFYDDPDVLFVSMHQSPFYPGSGAIDETGVGEGKGSTINMPLRAGHADASYKRLFEEIVWPAARRYKPDFIMVSAGFDAHWKDPLAGMRLSLDSYTYMNRELLKMADALCEGAIVFVMEGGYDLDVIGHGMANLVRACLGDEDIPDPLGPAPGSKNPDVETLINAVKQVHGL